MSSLRTLFWILMVSATVAVFIFYLFAKAVQAVFAELPA